MPPGRVCLGLLLLSLAGTSCAGDDPVPAGKSSLSPLVMCLDACAVTCEDGQGGIEDACAMECAFDCLCREECRLGCRGGDGGVDDACTRRCVSEECIPPEARPAG